MAKEKTEKDNVVPIKTKTAEATETQTENQENSPETMNEETVKPIELSTEKQAKISEYEKLGWTIGASYEHGWTASKSFPNEKQQVVFTDFDSLDVLFSSISEAEVRRQSGEFHEEVFNENEPEENNQHETDQDEIAKPREALPKTIYRNCLVNLKDDEIRARTDSMMEAMNESDNAERTFASVKDEHKSKIKTIQATIQRLRNAITSRIEWRDVECSEVFDYQKNLVHVFRNDTNQKVESRSMTDKERQQNLFN